MADSVSTKKSCSVEGCDKVLVARGLCGKHYYQWRNNSHDRPKCSTDGCDRPFYGKGLCRLCYDRAKFIDPERERCSVEGCGGPVRSLGLCEKHYTRKLRHGDIFGEGTPPGAPMKFIQQVVLTATDKEKCIIWPFGKSPGGYGIIHEGPKTRIVNRAILEMTIGKAPQGKPFALHTCGKGHLGCCSPAHMYWGDAKNNGADMVDHGTSPRGERQHMVKLSVSDVRLMRNAYKNGTHTQSELARMFGVGRQTVGSAITRKSWAWLD